MMDDKGLDLVGRAFAEVLKDLDFEVLFGIACKGVPLAVAASVVLRLKHGRATEVVYNRKEEKKHAEKGNLVGISPKGKKVAFIDDALSSGKSFMETFRTAYVYGCDTESRFTSLVVMLDRQERGLDDPRSAAEMLHDIYGIQVASVLTLKNITDFLDHSAVEIPGMTDQERRLYINQIAVYQDKYGV